MFGRIIISDVHTTVPCGIGIIDRYLWRVAKKVAKCFGEFDIPGCSVRYTGALPSTFSSAGITHHDGRADGQERGRQHGNIKSD